MGRVERWDGRRSVMDLAQLKDEIGEVASAVSREAAEATKPLVFPTALRLRWSGWRSRNLRML
jgi:hypothetical protein